MLFRSSRRNSFTCRTSRQGSSGGTRVRTNENSRQNKLAYPALSGDYYETITLPRESEYHGQDIYQSDRAHDSLRWPKTTVSQTTARPELLRQFRSSQDEAAYAGLLRRHGPMVLEVCRNVAGNEADHRGQLQATFHAILAGKAKSIRKDDPRWEAGSMEWRTERLTMGGGSLPVVKKHEGSRVATKLAMTLPANCRGARSSSLFSRRSWPRCPSSHRRRRWCCCFLEGRTQDEAAKQFKVLPKPSLKNHPERGRRAAPHAPGPARPWSDRPRGRFGMAEGVSVGMRGAKAYGRHGQGGDGSRGRTSNRGACVGEGRILGGDCAQCYARHQAKDSHGSGVGRCWP